MDYILDQIESSRPILDSIYSDIYVFRQKLMYFLTKLGVAITKFNQENRFHIYGWTIGNLKQVFNKIKDGIKFDRFNILIEGYRVDFYYKKFLLLTLLDYFYPHPNHKYTLPSYINKYELLQLGREVEICYVLNSLYDLTKWEDWDSLLETATEMYEFFSKPTIKKDYKITKFDMLESEFGGIVVDKQKIYRLIISFNKIDAFIERVQELSQGLSMQTIVNVGRTPWDIRHKSVLIKIDGIPAIKVYNCIDYELIPYYVKNNTKYAYWAVRARLFMLEYLLNFVLEQEKSIKHLMGIFVRIWNKEKMPLYDFLQKDNSGVAGIYQPTEEYEKEIQLLQKIENIKKRNLI